MKGMNPSN